MGVTSIERIPGRRARFGNGAREYEEQYRFYTAAPTDGAAACATYCLANGLKEGSPYADDAAARLQEIDVEESRESKTVWLVRFRFSTRVDKRDNPLDDPARIAWDDDKDREAIHEDTHGDAILNSAGDPFADPVDRPVTRRVITVRKNVADIPAWYEDATDVVNDADWTVDGKTLDAGTVALRTSRISEVQVRNEIKYRELTLEFVHDRRGWAVSRLDQGLRCKHSPGEGEDDITIAARVPGDGTTAKEPILLDGFGFPLSDPSPSNAVFLEFDALEEFDFDQFPVT